MDSEEEEGRGYVEGRMETRGRKAENRVKGTAIYDGLGGKEKEEKKYAEWEKKHGGLEA